MWKIFESEQPNPDLNKLTRHQPVIQSKRSACPAVIVIISKPETAILLHGTGQRETYCDECQVAVKWMLINSPFTNKQRFVDSQLENYVPLVTYYPLIL